MDSFGIFVIPPHDVTGLDHGLFRITPPTLKQGVGFFVALGILLFALVHGLSSLAIPDVPRTDEATLLSSLPEDDSLYDFAPVQSGYNNDEYKQEAAFVIVPLTLENGRVAEDECYWVEPDDEGNGGGWTYDLDMSDAEPLRFVDSSGRQLEAAFSLQGSLEPEGQTIEPPCYSEWYRTIEGQGEGDADNFHFAVYMLVEQDPERFQVLSIREISGLWVQGSAPPEVTQREDAGRMALLGFGVGGFIIMLCSEPSLRYDLRTIRKANGTKANDVVSGVGVLGSDGRLLQHLGPDGEVFGAAEHPKRNAGDDWLFGAPPLPTAYLNFFAPDGDGTLISEHPSKIGVVKPPMVTLYSLGGLVFAASFLWLAADLRARDGSGFHTILGWSLTALVTLVNVFWFMRAWNQFKLVRTIIDLPTSPVRSAAVGQVELVGQVRPSRAGTPELNVQGDVFQGIVAWTWSSYEYVCTTDSEGNTSCSWDHRRTEIGGVPFILHDGSGGMMIDPTEWDGEKGPFDHGPLLSTWQKGDWKWELFGLGVGDPVYVLGDCIPRTHEHMEEWGRDATLANSLVMMVPSSDTGEHSILHYGTELDLISQNRSMFEILVIPCLVFVFSVFMFVNYTP